MMSMSMSMMMMMSIASARAIPIISFITWMNDIMVANHSVVCVSLSLSLSLARARAHTHTGRGPVLHTPLQDVARVCCRTWLSGAGDAAAA